jgi:2-phospho-L-lactate/phosphoenolpyruvate guanylyltransferase
MAAVGTHGGTGWTVVLPVKRLTDGKSRLRGALPDVPHERLALALALDTAAAALAVAPVVAVTSDAAVRAALADLGARVVPDVPGGLNAAFVHGARLAGSAAPAGPARPAGPIAALAGDLPALRPAELAAALAAALAPADRARRFVADASGTGTALLTAPAAAALQPRFGPGSAAAHAASGAAPLLGPWPGLRRDVDTAADLAAAVALGVGRHTAALLPAGYGAAMQATVATYDPQTRSGTLLLDDGTRLDYPAAAFDASGLRLLRLGQRVAVTRDPAGAVSKITIPNLD